MAETVLALRDVLVRHGESTALQIASLDIQRGEILAVIGPNGAGKSTLLRVIGLLQQPTTGKVFFEGVEATRRNALRLRRRMASVFQEPLLVNASVFDNSALGLRMRGLSAEAIERQLRPWLKRLGIAHLAARRVRTLSGGEAQRTSLARALVLNPQLLLLDEPFSALDPRTREVLLLDLQKILCDTDVTTVLATHDRFEAFMLARRIGVLKRGRMLQLGSNLDVFAQPANAEVAEIVGIENRIAGVVETSSGGCATVRFCGGVVDVPGRFEPNTSVILCFRPEDISVTRPAEDPNFAVGRNQLHATIAKVYPWMYQYRLALECGQVHLVAIIDRVSFRKLAVAEGDGVRVSIDPAAVHVIERDGTASLAAENAQ